MLRTYGRVRRARDFWPLKSKPETEHKDQWRERVVFWVVCLFRSSENLVFTASGIQKAGVIRSKPPAGDRVRACFMLRSAKYRGSTTSTYGRLLHMYARNSLEKSNRYNQMKLHRRPRTIDAMYDSLMSEKRTLTLMGSLRFVVDAGRYAM